MHDYHDLISEKLTLNILIMYLNREMYKSHTVSKCPILRQYTCRTCGERGHTV